MESLKVFETVVNTKSYRLARQRKDSKEYDLKSTSHAGNKKGWIFIDLFTASAVMQVYNALNDANKITFAKMPLIKMVNITWRLIK